MVFVAGNATYKSPCRSVRPSVPSFVPLYLIGVFELFEGRIARVLVSYGYLCPCPNDFCPCPYHYCPCPTARAPAIGAVVYSALFFCEDPWLGDQNAWLLFLKRWRRRKRQTSSELAFRSVLNYLYPFKSTLLVFLVEFDHTISFIFFDVIRQKTQWKPSLKYKNDVNYNSYSNISNWCFPL